MASLRLHIKLRGQAIVTTALFAREGQLAPFAIARRTFSSLPEPPTASKVAAKAASRAFQRFVTPDAELKRRQDPAESPEAKTVSGFAKGKAKDTFKSRLRNPLLMRLGLGFGVLLPLAGTFFSAKAVFSDVQRVKQVPEKTQTNKEGFGRSAGISGLYKASAAYTVAGASDAVLFLASVKGLATAFREHVPFNLPLVVPSPLSIAGVDAASAAAASASTLDLNLLHLYSSYYEDFLALPAAFAPACALLATGSALMGQLWERHGTTRNAAFDVAPIAAVKAEEVAIKAKKGDLGPEEAAEEMLRVADQAIDEAAPNLLESAQAREHLGESIGELDLRPKGARDNGANDVSQQDESSSLPVSPPEELVQPLKEAATALAEKLEEQASGNPKK